MITEMEKQSEYYLEKPAIHMLNLYMDRLRRQAFFLEQQPFCFRLYSQYDIESNLS